MIGCYLELYPVQNVYSWESSEIILSVNHLDIAPLAQRALLNVIYVGETALYLGFHQQPIHGKLVLLLFNIFLI